MKNYLYYVSYTFCTVYDYVPNAYRPNKTEHVCDEHTKTDFVEFSEIRKKEDVEKLKKHLEEKEGSLTKYLKVLGFYKLES